MRRNLILSFFLLVHCCMQAQHNDIRLNVGLHGNLPERLFNPSLGNYNGKNGGMGVHLCPTWHWHSSKKLSFGINMEYAFVEENYQTDAIGGFSIFSAAPTIQYYFTNHKIRPFVGLGAGVYHVLDHDPKLNPGIRPIIGVSFSHIFNLSLEYNRILTNVKVDPKVNGAFDNYYLALKGSFSIGVYDTGRP